MNADKRPPAGDCDLAVARAKETAKSRSRAPRRTREFFYPTRPIVRTRQTERLRVSARWIAAVTEENTYLEFASSARLLNAF